MKLNGYSTEHHLPPPSIPPDGRKSEWLSIKTSTARNTMDQPSTGQPSISSSAFSNVEALHILLPGKRFTAEAAIYISYLLSPPAIRWRRKQVYLGCDARRVHAQLYRQCRDISAQFRENHNHQNAGKAAAQAAFRKSSEHLESRPTRTL